MPGDLMKRCEIKTAYMRDGRKVPGWKEIPVSELSTGTQPGVRCVHCHGGVRVHKQHVAGHGPADHVEHLDHQDSEHCIGGHFFLGEHRMSIHPAE